MKNKLTFLAIILVLLVACSSIENDNNITYTFELNEVFGIEKADPEQKKFHYSTHAVQDEKLLVSRNELNHEVVTELITKELLLVDLNTRKIDLLLKPDREMRIWDYVLIEDGFLYSTIENAFYDHFQNEILKFKVIEHIDGKERILDEGNSLNPFKTPSFHFIDDVIYYGMESIQYIDNVPRKMAIDLVRYEKGSKDNIISIENIIDQSYYVAADSEVLLKTELNKGKNSLGFVTHILEEKQSNVYVVDAAGEYTRKTVEGIVTDLMLFENRTVYQLINLTEDEEIESVVHYDLKNNKKLLIPGIDDVIGRVVAIDQNTLGFIGQDFYPYLANSDRKDVRIHKVDFNGFGHFDLSFIYPVDSEKLLLVQFTDEMPLKLSIIDIMEAQTDN